MPVFRWDDRKTLAAQLVAERKIGHNEVAARVGIDQKTLTNWKNREEFAARVNELIRQFAETVRQSGIAILENRVEQLQHRWMLMQEVIRARGASPEMQGVPGGPTGLLVHTVKGVGRGEDFQLIDLYEIDTGLLNELRQHEKQAAQELGQWTEKKEIGGDPEKPVIVKTLRGVTVDELP